jgi:peptidoglycan/LPS O-acetylase OafA/YrhL
MTSKASYRADVDGLRAVAVVPVVLFHCGLSFLGGGFVGVDVFFVISGFLITSILHRELQDGTYSLITFYERRVRRIAPALLAVLAFTAVLAPFYLLKADLRDFGRSAMATLFFGSNVYFRATTDYFSAAAEFKPLLHTWSLAVEEQYYIVFPVLLAVMTRVRPAVLLAVMAAAAAVSLGISEIQTVTKPEAAFYLPTSRAWELLLGSMLAIAPAPARAFLARPVFGWAGLAMIAAAVGLYSDQTDFPGVAALLPCVGAVMVLGSGTGSAARLLGSAPFRWIGLISYSLYLWHWPLLALYRYHFGPDIPPLAVVGLLACMTAAAWLSWRYVEQPWRVRTPYWTRRRIFATAGTFAALLMASAAILSVLDQHMARFSPQVAQLARAAEVNVGWYSRCETLSIARIQKGEVCTIGTTNVAPTFAVIGDSIGSALMPGIAAAAVKEGRSGLVLTYAGCRPLLAVISPNARCQPHLEAALALLKARPGIERVIVLGRWANMAEGNRFGESHSPPKYLMDAQTAKPTYRDGQRVFDQSMRRLLARLFGKVVSVVAFVPEQSIHVPRVLSMRALRGAPPIRGISREQHERRNANVRRILTAAAQEHGAQVIDFGQFACDSTECPVVTSAGEPLYRDDNHPSEHAALLWQDAFVPALSPQDAPPVDLDVRQQ